jgi:hypothetical protein
MSCADLRRRKPLRHVPHTIRMRDTDCATIFAAVLRSGFKTIRVASPALVERGKEDEPFGATAADEGRAQ